MYEYSNILFTYNLTDICVKIIFIIKVNNTIFIEDMNLKKAKN